MQLDSKRSSNIVFAARFLRVSDCHEFYKRDSNNSDNNKKVKKGRLWGQREKEVCTRDIQSDF